MFSIVLLLAVGALNLRALTGAKTLSDFNFSNTTEIRVAKVHVILDKAFLSIVKKGSVTFDSTTYFNRIEEYINPIFAVQVGLVFKFGVTEVTAADCATAPFLCDTPQENLLGLCEADGFETKKELDALLEARLNTFSSWVKNNALPDAGSYYLFTGCSYRMEQPLDDTNILGFTITPEFAKKYLAATAAWSGTAGIANLGTWCSSGNTGIVTKNMNDGTKTMFGQAMTLAHELGHTIGMHHFGMEWNHTTECAGIMDYCGNKVGNLRRFVVENWNTDAKKVLNTLKSDQSKCFDSASATSLPNNCTLGNGICEPGCNIEGLQYDGGDCNLGEDTPVCARGCYKHFIGDGKCDPDCMVPACWGDKSRNGKTEKDDCECKTNYVITKCQVDTERNVEKCILRCGSTVVDKLLTESRKVLDAIDGWLADAPAWIRDYAGFWIGGIILFVTLCCLICCCGKK